MVSTDTAVNQHVPPVGPTPYYATPEEKKNSIEHVETVAHLETKYASLGRWAVCKLFWKSMIFCAILSWAAMDDGFQQQIPGNLIPMQAFINQMADTTLNGEPIISARVVSFWQGFAEMAKMTGYGAGGYLSDRFGRKGTMYISCFLLLVGTIFEIVCQNWRQWLGAAWVIRLGVGLTTSTLVIYISEIAPFQVRGFMVGSYQLLLGFGQLIAAIATQLVTTKQPTKWRPLIATEFIWIGLLCALMPLAPESHLYYARKEQHEKAKHSMVRLYSTAPDYDVEYEYKVITQGIEAERAFSHMKKDVHFLEIFRGVNWKRTLAGTAGIMTQPFAGSPIVFGYSTYFFKAAGLDMDPFIITIITFVILICAIACSMVACEFVGRRPLLIGGCVSMLIFNIILATTGFFTSQASGKLALASLLIWVFSYGLSAGPLGFVASGETSTPRLRGITTGFNLFCYGIGFVIFQWTISYMISADADNWGVKAIYVWVGLLIPTIIILYLYYPETYGRTYNELDELYERGIPAWRFKSTQTFAESSGQKGLASQSHGVVH